MIPLQIPGATELVVIALNLIILVAILAGILYVVRRVRAPTDVHERLDSIEQELDALKAQVGDRGKDESD